MPYVISAQSKEYSINRTSTPPIVDGHIHDEFWKDIPATGDFLSYLPQSGELMPKNLNTQWKAVYDNQAIYLLFTCMTAILIA